MGARGQATWAAASPVMVPEAVARMEMGGAEGMEAVGSVAAAARREGVGTVEDVEVRLAAEGRWAAVWVVA